MISQERATDNAGCGNWEAKYTHTELCVNPFLLLIYAKEDVRHPSSLWPPLFECILPFLENAIYRFWVLWHNIRVTKVHSFTDVKLSHGKIGATSESVELGYIYHPTSVAILHTENNGRPKTETNSNVVINGFYFFFCWIAHTLQFLVLLLL